ncbi:MAG TPA: extracellular solute-binding protein [Clostridia bacterium]|nr:extracellular solute-binding protein [Clostridia bacterium]
MKKRLTLGFALLLCVTLVLGGLSGASAAQEGWLVDQETVLDVMMSESSLVPLSNDFTYYQLLYEKTGIKINFMAVPSSDFNTKKSLVLSTNDLPDIMLVGQSDLNLYATEDLFVNLSDHAAELPNFFEIVERYPVAKTTYIDGSAYAFPTLARWDMLRGSSLILRQDILDALGIDSASIKTFEDFFGVMQQVKAAHPDMVPFITRGGASNQMMILGYALGSGSGITYDPQMEKWCYEPARPETKDVLAYLNRMYVEGLLDPDYATLASNEWQQKMANNQGFAYFDNVNFANTNLAALQSIVPEAVWSVIPVPLNSFGYSRAIYTNPHQISRLWVIASKSTKIDAALKLFNELYTEEACDLLNLGVEGVDFYRNEAGECLLTDEVIAKYSTDGVFVKTAMQAVCGNAAYETFIPYSDNRAYFIQVPEHQLAWYTTIQNDPAFALPVNPPPFTEDERDELSEITTGVNTIATEMFDKLIMGLDSLDNFDVYAQSMKEAGAERIEEIYNAAQARMQ